MKAGTLVSGVLLLAVLGSGCGSVESARGWQLMEFSRSGPTYAAVAAERQDDLDAFWERFTLSVDQPAVDFDTQILIGLGHAAPGNCPGIDFRGLVVDDDHVYGRYDHDDEFPLFGGCNEDANPAMFWIRVDREVLPNRFTLSVARDNICPGPACLNESMEVELTSDQPDGSQWWEEPSSRLPG